MSTPSEQTRQNSFHPTSYCSKQKPTEWCWWSVEVAMSSDSYGEKASNATDCSMALMDLLTSSMASHNAKMAHDTAGCFSAIPSMALKTQS